MAWDIEPIEGDARRAWFEAHSEPGYPLLVAETDDGTISGWASLSRWAHHAAYARTAELSIYATKTAGTRESAARCWRR